MSLSYQKVFGLAIPVMLANISVPLVGIVDTAVMGRLESPDYLNSVAIASTLLSALFWAFGFLRMGTGGMVAQAYGRAEPLAVSLITVRNLGIAMAIGIAVIVVGPVWLWLGMLAMETSAELADLVVQYFSIRLLAAPITLCLYVVFGTLVGLQRMRALLLLQLLLNILNIALNILLFTMFDWHVRGVAIATVVSEIATLAVGLFLLRAVVLPCVLELRRHLPALLERQALRRLWSISRDLFIRTCCLTFAFYWITVMSSREGSYVLAANTIILHLLHVMAHMLDGFAHAAEALAGQAYGQNQRRALKDAVRSTTVAAFTVSLLICMIFLFFSTDFVAMMSTDKAVQATAASYLPWIYLAPVIGVWSFMFDGIYAGTTHTREMRDGMLVSLVLFLLCAWLLVPAFGNHGIWISYHLLMIARACTLAYWYRRIPAALQS